MYRHRLIKPDGRHLTLYGRNPIGHTAPARSPRPTAVNANPHLRWHPLLGAWVAYASYRQDRTFLPPPEYNPLLPSDDADNPTELPCGDYDIAVFDNLFPVLAPTAHDPPQLPIETAPARGRCEVVVFTQDPHTALGQLSLDRLELLLEVWGERTAKLAGEQSIQYVLPFENRGVEVGVTLHHPHGQIYAYPFVPPNPRRMQEQQSAYLKSHGASLFESIIEAELRDERRLLYSGPHAIAFIPVCARYSYEVWVAPRASTAYLFELTAEQRTDLARAFKTVLLKYDGLWQRPFPYVMAWYQAPTDGQEHPEFHLHAQFYPAYRTRDKLKFLAGTELAAGMFANDALPEDKADELRRVEVNL